MGSVDPALHPPVAFPDADWAWFTARCNALAISGAGPRRAALQALYGHLVGVNRWLNLTTITAPRDFLKQHLLDSLVLEPDTRLRHLSEGAPCVDLGAGGGYPGLPLALWHPTVPWVLVDTRRKKVDFLEAAAALLAGFGAPRVSARHLRGSEVSARASDLQRNCQLVTCRAMGQASEVLTEAADLLQKSGHVVIYKGPGFAGPERETAMNTANKLGYRFVVEKKVVLEEGDPERVMVVYERTR